MCFLLSQHSMTFLVGERREREREIEREREREREEEKVERSV